MIHELQQFHVEASKRALLNSTKECSLMLYSFQSERNNKVQTINYSENPINAFVRALWQNENYSEILEFTTTESENDPVLFYFHLKSLVKLKSKNIEDMLEIIDKKVEFSSDPFINYCKANIYYEKEDFSSTFQESTKILQNYPFFWDAWLLLIDSVRYENQIQLVFELAKSSNTLMSLNAVLHLHMRIRNSIIRKMFSSFESIFKSEKFFNNIYLRNIKIKYYTIENNGLDGLPHQSQSYYLQMADIYSDFLYLNSKTDELKIFAKYMTATRGWTKECCYVVGNIYSLLHKHELSILWLKRSLIIDPNYESALIVLGNEYINLKSPADAISAYSSAIKLNPLNYRSFFSLGLVYYLLDDLDRAIYFLKIAAKLEPNDYRPFELLSECYQNLGFPEHAVEYLNSAKKCSNSPFSLIKKLALLHRSVADFKEYLKFYINYFEQHHLNGGTSDLILSDDSDFEAATIICKNNSSSAILDKLKRAILCYNKFE